MSKDELKSKPAEGGEARKDAENIVTKTREAITHAMEMADLQLEMFGLDMGNMTPKKVEAFFAPYEEDPIAQRLKDRMLCILEIRNDLNDRELLGAIFGLDAMGPVGIQTTPVSISMDFYNPIDWAKVTMKKEPLLRGLTDFLLPKGISSTRDFTVKDKNDGTSSECKINIDYHRAYGFTGLRRIKKHEQRHSMNREVKAYPDHSWRLLKSLDKDDDELTNIILEDLSKISLNRLKSELSAFIVAGNKSKLALKHIIFKLGPLIGKYDFIDADNPSFWDFWRKKGLRESVIERVKKELPKRINVPEILERSYAAVELLERKGHSREWAVSFLCADDNLRKDWLTLAEACPAAATRNVR